MDKLFEQLDFTYENELFQKRNDIQEDCAQFQVYSDDLDATFLELLSARVFIFRTRKLSNRYLIRKNYKKNWKNFLNTFWSRGKIFWWLYLEFFAVEIDPTPKFYRRLAPVWRLVWWSLVIGQIFTRIFVKKSKCHMSANWFRWRVFVNWSRWFCPPVARAK